jgi:hypothetical protein
VLPQGLADPFQLSRQNLGMLRQLLLKAVPTLGGLGKVLAASLQAWG